jgi:hypothetical protein
VVKSRERADARRGTEEEQGENVTAKQVLATGELSKKTSLPGDSHGPVRQAAQVIRGLL